MTEGGESVIVSQGANVHALNEGEKGDRDVI